MKPKISIIVPIFNMEPYLQRCLDSLIAQSMEDIQIIAVNDGSTDGSAKILSRYADQDDRIHVIHKENGGVSSARNAGIVAAEGDYIGFVDPDDWVEASMYEELYETAVQEQADIVMCSYIREFGTHAKEKQFELPEKICYRNAEVKTKVMRRLVGPLKEEISNPELLDAWGTVWSKLYRASLIKEHHLAFVDLKVVGTNEDTLFNIHALYYANGFVFLNRPYYHYWRVNTTSVTSGFKPHLIDQWFVLYGMIETFLLDNKMTDEFELALNNRICLNTLGLGLNTISKGNTSSALLKLKKLHSILHDERIQRSFKRFEISYCSAVWRAFYSFAKYKFVVGFYVLLSAIDWLRTVKR